MTLTLYRAIAFILIALALDNYGCPIMCDVVLSTWVPASGADQAGRAPDPNRIFCFKLAAVIFQWDYFRFFNLDQIFIGTPFFSRVPFVLFFYAYYAGGDSDEGFTISNSCELPETPHQNGI